MTKLFAFFWTRFTQKWQQTPIVLQELEEEILDFDLAPYLGWMEEERQGNVSL